MEGDIHDGEAVVAPWLIRLRLGQPLADHRAPMGQRPRRDGECRPASRGAHQWPGQPEVREKHVMLARGRLGDNRPFLLRSIPLRSVRFLACGEPRPNR